MINVGIFYAFIGENDPKSQLYLQQRSPCMPRPSEAMGLPRRPGVSDATKRLLENCIQARLERPMDKLLLAKNPTNFTLQWGTTCVLSNAFKWTVNYWWCFWSSIILTNLKNCVSYLTEQLIFFIKCWQIYFLSEIKMALFSLECTNVLFIYIYFLKISLIFTEFMSFALGLFFS